MISLFNCSSDRATISVRSTERQFPFVWLSDNLLNIQPSDNHLNIRPSDSHSNIRSSVDIHLNIWLNDSLLLINRTSFLQSSKRAIVYVRSTNHQFHSFDTTHTSTTIVPMTTETKHTQSFFVLFHYWQNQSQYSTISLLSKSQYRPTHTINPIYLSLENTPYSLVVAALAAPPISSELSLPFSLSLSLPTIFLSWFIVIKDFFAFLCSYLIQVALLHCYLMWVVAEELRNWDSRSWVVIWVVGLMKVLNKGNV